MTIYIYIHIYIYIYHDASKSTTKTQQKQKMVLTTPHVAGRSVFGWLESGCQSCRLDPVDSFRETRETSESRFEVFEVLNVEAMSLANCLERCGKTVDFIYALDDRRKFPFEATKRRNQQRRKNELTTLRQVDQMDIDRSQRLVNVLCAAERVQNLDESVDNEIIHPISRGQTKSSI